MVYTGERAYPGRAQRMAAPKRSMIGVYCAVLVLFVAIAFILTIIWGQTSILNAQVAAARNENERLSDNIEATRTQLERAESYDEITLRAEEMGLSKTESAYSVTIPDRT